MEMREIEIAAKKGGSIPSGLTFAEMQYFICLREVYKQYFNGFIDLETAKKDKRVLLAKCKKEEKVNRLQADIYTRCHEAVRKSADLIIKIRKTEDEKERYNCAIECISVFAQDPMLMEYLRE